MTSDHVVKTVIVFGASGFIGRAITRSLLNAGMHVLAACRWQTMTREDFTEAMADAGDGDEAKLDLLFTNVTEGDSLIEALTGHEVDGVVFAVGDCPPHGFQSEFSSPLTSPSGLDWLKETLELHVFGLSKVLHSILSHLRRKSHIIVLGSAITEIEEWPDWLHAGHFAAACAAKQQIVRAARIDPAFRHLDTRFHYLGPGAVDTPFHHGAPDNMRSPAYVSVSDLVVAVSERFTMIEHSERVWRANPPA